MKDRIKSGLLAAGMLAFMLTVPAYPHAAAEDGGNGGKGAGMGTGVGTLEANSVHGSAARPNRDVSVYGTPTGSQYWNSNDSDNTHRGSGVRTYSTTNGTDGIHTNAVRSDGRVHAASTTTNRSSNWGWLGLLGLIGLAGVRGRNPERDKR